jgi:hypothetical protein
MTRLYRTRKISKYARKYGEADFHLQDVLQKPILTARDKEVLLSIYYHRCLTTEQVAEIHFRYDSKGKFNNQASIIARRRLRKLFDYALVDRFFVDVGDGQGSSQAHIMLDSLGAKVVAGLLNLKPSEVDWKYEMNEARLPYLSHMISINDFYLYTLKSAREMGHEASHYRTENHVRHEFSYWGGKVIFNPDAYGQYWMGDEGRHYFLEWDNGTMSPTTFQKKHQRYTAFYDSDEYKKYYETFPMILTVTTSWDRAASLARMIGEVDNTDKVWLFASEADVKANGVGTIWIDKRGKPASLFD